MLQKNKVRVAIQMDSLDKVNKETDSTLALIEEAYKRRFDIFVYTVDKLYLEKNKPKAYARKVLGINLNKKKYIDLEKDVTVFLSAFDVVLIRQDPPFDMQYITSTYLLEKLPNKCLVLNKPGSIRDCPEKLFVMDFFHLMPPTLISKNFDQISNFIKKYKQVVIKPLYGNGGSNVYYLNEKDPNLNIIIGSLVEGREHVIAQKFIKKVKLGDKRVLLINGKPVGAVNRIPSKHEIRANLHIGGLARKTSLNKKELDICHQIKDSIISKGLFFSGIDIIDGYLTEINVTSPTCIREIDYLNGTNISKIFWDEVEFLKVK